MVTFDTSERVVAALQQAHHHWETYKGSGGGTPDLVIAISREAGARGPQVARRAGELLGWPVYDRELLEMIANKKGLRVQLLECVDERKVHWLRECMEAFGGVPRVSESAYVSYLVETLYSLASLGHCVIVGRGAVQVLPPQRTLRVRLVGPVQDRVQAVSRKFVIPVEEAARWVEKTDRERCASSGRTSTRTRPTRAATTWSSTRPG